MNSKLPKWELIDLYSSIESKELINDFSSLEYKSQKFFDRFKGNVAQLTPSEFSSAILEFEFLQECICRISSFAELSSAENFLDTKVSNFAQSVQERLNLISSKILFFTLEINNISNETITTLVADRGVARYGSWIKNVRVFREYQLSEELEQLLHEKKITGKNAWNRLFDETVAALEFDFLGQKKSLEEVLDKFSDRDASVRQKAGESLSREFQKNIRLFAIITNTLAKDKEIEDRWRNYPAVDTFRHLSNLIEPEVVDALVMSIEESYPRTSHRYYKMKARWLGLNKLHYWDRNAPLPTVDERVWSWDEAVDLVISSYEQFSPELASVGRLFFEHPWIDASPRKGKAAGAFAHPTAPSVHPYLLMNYQGKTSDVMTLAHELGHGIHQMLAAPNGILLSETPLTLAETASVFGEQLTFRALLATASTRLHKRALIAAKVEDMLNTVVRQISFYNFERRLHRERRTGELSQERLGKLWMEVQSESLGPAFSLSADYANYWCYVPHFVHEPFYVYAYAFGDCLVNSLYSVYLQGNAGFQEKYLRLLRAGGTRSYRELLALFGLDASEPGFWKQGLTVMENLIDELAEIELEG